MAEPIVVQSVKASDLTSSYITTTFWHEPNSSLRVGGLEGVDIVDEGRLGRDLEVSDDGVSFAAEVHQVGVWVVDGEHDAVACVQLHHHDRVVQVS